MKILLAVTRSIFIICLPVFLFTVTVAVGFNCRWIYVNGFEKYDVQKSLADNGLNLTDNDMKEIANGFIHYFNSSDEYINLFVRQDGELVPLFTREEAIHFKDVKRIIRLDYYVAIATFAYCLIFALVSILTGKDIFRKKLAWNMIIGSSVTMILMLAMGVGILLDFDSLFLRFHFLAFSNEFWSAEGNMLLLTPGGFWNDVFLYGTITIVVSAIVLGSFSGAYLIYSKRKDRKKSITIKSNGVSD
jgi:integral membrane protein (TIGR01906 family)